MNTYPGERSFDELDRRSSIPDSTVIAKPVGNKVAAAGTLAKTVLGLVRRAQEIGKETCGGMVRERANHNVAPAAGASR